MENVKRAALAHRKFDVGSRGRARSGAKRAHVATQEHARPSSEPRRRRTAESDDRDLVAAIRAGSRALVRELGLLASRTKPGGLTLAECHALLELDSTPHGSLLELAERLRIDKAATSRTVASLARRGYLVLVRDRHDARRRIYRLTPSGRRKVREVHATANATVSMALERIDPSQRAAIADSLSIYSRALNKSRRAARYELRRIEPSDDRAMASIIRDVMTEHGASGKGFAIHDAEVDAMSRAYRGRRARYFVVVRNGGVVVGGGGFAPLSGADRDICELRKMYFRPECRGLGVGRALLERLLVEMRKCGFRRCYLETLGSMTAARKLYVECGFKPRCSPLGTTGHFSCDAFYERSL